MTDSPALTLFTPSVLVTYRSAWPLEESVADTGFRLVTPWVETMAPAGRLLIRLPAAVARTLTCSVQTDPAAMLALVIDTTEAPAVAVMAPPVQPVPPKLALGVGATTMPVGRLSVSPTPVSATASALLLRMRTVIIESKLSGPMVGLKPLASAGTARRAVSVALAAAWRTPGVLLIVLAAMVLTALPLALAAALTATVMVQLLFEPMPAGGIGSAPPVNVRTPVPGVAVAVPPQLLFSAGLAATSIA